MPVKSLHKHKQHSIQYNFIMNFILTASSVLFPLITFPYVSRVLLPVGTGKVAFATSMVSYFSMIALLGVPTYGIRAVARARSDPAKLKQVVHELVTINFVMTLISYALFGICLFLIPDMADEKALMLVCSSAILLNSMGVNWFYQGMEEYTYITIVSVIFKILSVVTMFIFVRNQNDYIWYGVMSVLSSYGSGIVNFFRLPRYLSHEKVEYHYWHHLKGIFVFFAMTVATTIYTHLDTAMLGFMKGDYETGLYNAGTKIKTLLTMLITSLGTVLLPRLSAYIAQGRSDEFERLVSKAISFVLLFSLPVCLYCSVYTSDILIFLCGEPYLPASACMEVLMPTIVLIGLSNITGIQILVPLNRERQVLVSVACGAVVDFALNLYLIRVYGAAGAALGTLAAELIVLGIQIYYLRKHALHVLKKVEWKPLLGGLLFFSAALLALAGHLHYGAFVNLVISALICFGLYGLALIMTKEEIVTSFLRSHGWGK